MSFESRFDFVPLGSLAKFINGDRGENYPKPTDYVTEGIPFLSATDVGEGKIAWREAKKISPVSYSKLRSGQVQRGDLLFCLRGSLGKLGYVENDLKGAIASSLVILRASNESIARYLRFVLGSADAQCAIKSLDNGSVQGNISAAALKSLMVPNPPEGIRTSITAVLESVDGRIDLNHRINQTLETMAQAIFKSWFVDFDPVKAKIAAKQEGRDPMRAAMSVISGKPDAELDTLPPEQYAQLATTAALFPDEMEESELGEIPRGWIVSDMRTLAEVISKGTTPNKPDLANAKDAPTVPFVKVKDISEDGEIARGNLELIARSIHESSLKRSILKTDDLLFSIAGTIGRTAFVDNDLNGANVNQAIAFIRLKDKLDHFALCWLTLRNIETKNFIASKVVQAVQANASLANVGDIPVRLPSNDVLKKWNSVVSPLILEFRARLGEIRTLATLRDTLLPKLMSGELSVTALTESTGVA
jgi:type I restriction enzyme S subunit